MINNILDIQVKKQSEKIAIYQLTISQQATIEMKILKKPLNFIMR